jgi:methylglutaconyl-CoA hydratase
MTPTPIGRNWSLDVAHGVARLALARPQVRNALDADTIREGLEAFRELASRRDVRVVVLRGEGSVFCAGADLNYMKAMRDATAADNERDAQQLGSLFATVAGCSKPVIARVHGAALGGGAGLVAACDVAVTAEDTSFAFSEVRLGVIPAVISPYLVRRMGATRLRRAVLTGYRFDAAEAHRLGLVDVVSTLGDLDRDVDEIAADFLAAGPEAVAAAKDLLDFVAHVRPADAAAEIARRIARIRTTAEAQEGMAAFLEKRRPSWAEAAAGGE